LKRLLRRISNLKVLRIGAWSALASILLLSIPIPLGCKKTDKSGIPFPCQDRPCGCSSAEQCWTSCGCFTTGERVAWAKKNGVEIPNYAVLDNAQPLFRDSTHAKWQEPLSKVCQSSACSCSSKDQATPKIKSTVVVTKALGSCCSSNHSDSSCGCSDQLDKTYRSSSKCCCVSKASQTTGQAEVVRSDRIAKESPNWKLVQVARSDEEVPCEQTKELPLKTIWIFSIETQKCRGAQLEYLFAVVQVIVPVESLVGELEFVEYIACAPHDVLPGTLRQPPDPPPPKFYVAA
jgi:hypothetical protein